MIMVIGIDIMMLVRLTKARNILFIWKLMQARHAKNIIPTKQKSELATRTLSCFYQYQVKATASIFELLSLNFKLASITDAPHFIRIWSSSFQEYFPTTISLYFPFFYLTNLVLIFFMLTLNCANEKVVKGFSVEKSLLTVDLASLSDMMKAAL